MIVFDFSDIHHIVRIRTSQKATHCERYFFINELDVLGEPTQGNAVSAAQTLKYLVKALTYSKQSQGS
jgi:hypothetical protein